jgi:hypothetical protein
VGGPLAGRVGEIQTVTRVLAGETDSPALVVIGVAGVGKSRLLAGCGRAGRPSGSAGLARVVLGDVGWAAAVAGRRDAGRA